MTALLDRVLGPRFEGRNQEQLRRARLVLSASVMMALSAFSYAGLLTVLNAGKVFIPELLVSGTLLIAGVWLLRRTGHVEISALILSGAMLLAVIAASWQQGGPQNNVFFWGPMACVTALLLAGPRLGWICVAAEVVHLVILTLAQSAGHVFPALMQNRPAIFINQLAATLFAAAFAYLWDRSRREAMAARDQAMASVQESQEARIALVENVEAAIFSVDRDLNLTAGNARFMKLGAQGGGVASRLGRPILNRIPESQRADIEALLKRALAGEQVSTERRLEHQGGIFEAEIRLNPIRRASGEVRGVTVLARDISERNRAQAELLRLNRQLADAAHLAGKAEVATDVLHNVGNALAGLNGSADLVFERLQTSKTPFLGKAVAMMPTHPDELARFLTGDDQGRQLREYLGKLATSLEEERAELTAEVVLIHRQLDHIKSVVARQQAFARGGDLVEVVALERLIDEALQMSMTSFARHKIELKTEIAPLPPLALDRHKLIEILSNFIANSRQALDASQTPAKRLVVRAFQNQQANLQIDVSDNGVGISPEHCERLFAYGFTTKPEGHGFGLAGSLLAARSMGGTARGTSEGEGKGATFTIELPWSLAATHPQERAA